MMAGIETKNADATVAALQTDTIYTLLPPAGITVVPGSVKATLGQAVAPAPAADPATTTTTPAADTTTESSSSSGGSNAGAIAGAVIGVVAGVAILGGAGFWVSRVHQLACQPPTASMQSSLSCNGWPPAVRRIGLVHPTHRTLAFCPAVLPPPEGGQGRRRQPGGRPHQLVQPCFPAHGRRDRHG